MKTPAQQLQRTRVTIICIAIALLLSGTVSLFAYRGNSQHAKRLYEQLLAVDAAGGDVEKALFELRSFMHRHMNTSIGSETGVRPPIQLKGTYERLVAAEQQRVKVANDELYVKAQQECERRQPQGFSGRNRVECITQYVTQNAIKEQPIPDSLYKFDFVSPRWSPDVAGFGIVITAVLGIILLFQVSLYRRLVHHLKMSS